MSIHYRRLLVAILASWGCGWAMAAPPVYTMGAQVQPLKFNNLGVQVGSVNKSPVSRLESGWYYDGLGFRHYEVKWVTYVDVYPVTYANGVSKTWPRFNGTTNTLGEGVLDDGSLLVSVAPTSGKRPKFDAATGYQPHLLSTNNTFTRLSAASMDGVKFNRKGWLALTTASDVQFTTPGNLSGGKRYAPATQFPGSVSYFAGVDVSSNGQGLLRVYPGGNAGDSCVAVTDSGNVVLAAPQANWTMQCMSINASASVAGVMSRPGGAPNYNTEYAPFVWRNGQFQTLAFEFSQTAISVKLLDNGVLVADMGPKYDASTGKFSCGVLLIRPNGERFVLQDLLAKPLPAGQYLTMVDVNDAGQILASVVGAPGSPTYVLTPSGL